MENNGWVKIHRKLLENPLCKSPEWAWVWMCLLLMANHDENSFIWNGKVVKLKAGQFLTGRKKIAETAKVSESLVEKILNFLESEQQIEQQKTTKYRIITIVNWNKYQEKDNKSNNSVTTARQQRDTNKNDNNEKNVNTLATEAVAGEKPKFNPLGGEIINAFVLNVNPSCSRYYNNTTQREACDGLIKSYGLEKVLNAIKVLPKTNKQQFYPRISTPLQLYEKYEALRDAWERDKQKIDKEKVKQVII